MHTVFSQALTSTGWSVSNDLIQSGLSFRTTLYASGTPSITTRTGPPPAAEENLMYSPKYDLGSVRTVVVSLEVLKPWIADSAVIGAWIKANYSNENLSLPGRAFSAQIQTLDEAGLPLQNGVPFDGEAEITGRYFSFVIYGPKLYTTDNVLYPPVDYADWKVDLTGGTLIAKMPITAESVSTTTSATVPVTVSLAERYLAITGIASGAESTVFANVTTEAPVTGEYLPNTINVNGFDAAGTRLVKKAYVTVLGVRGNKTKTNWAASANGATASATSTTGAFAASFANNGSFDASSNAYWAASAAQPQTLTIDYGAARNVTEIVAVFLNDALGGAVTVFDVATLYHATSFTIQEFVSGVWTTISGGTVTGNTKVMRRFTVTNSGATKVRITISASPNLGSYVVELQAIGPA